jgi:hypothetical protein
MTADDVEIAVVRLYDIRATLVVPNASWGAGVHECDLLILTNSGYLTEVEIKVTKADLVADLKKTHAHRSDKIKKLFYALPESVLSRPGVKEIIPAHAGIISVDVERWGDGRPNHWRNHAHTARFDREAAINGGARPITEAERYEIARLGALRIWDLKRRLQKIRLAL